MISEPAMCVRAVCALAAVASALSAAQFVANAALFRDGGLLDWEFVRRRGAAGQLLGRMRSFGASAVIALLTMKLLASLWLLAGALVGTSLLAPLALLVATNTTLSVRIPWCRTAADDLCGVVALALFIAACAGTDTAMRAALVFIAALAMLAYGTSGVIKAHRRIWWNGEALATLFDGPQFGQPWLARLFGRHRWIAPWLGRGVVIWECAMPLAVVVPQPWALGLLSMGLAFHVGTAVVMGLNTFVWAFAATYPAILFVNHIMWLRWL